MRFTYSALNQQQNIVSGTIEANNQQIAIDLVRKLGYRPLTIKPEKKGFSFSLTNSSVKADELTIFSRQLASMVAASVPLLRALSSLAGNGQTPLQKILKQVIENIEGGDSLADALAKHPKVFDDIYVSMVRAGETAGILEDILRRLAIQQEKAATMRKKIKSAMSYPMVLMIITVIAFFALMIFVIPQVGEIMSNLGGENTEMPAITTFMLGLSNFILQTWFIIFPILGGIIYNVLRYIKTPVGKKKFDRLLLKIPAIKTIVLKTVVARFSRTFSALMGAGVSVINALEVTADSVGNDVYRTALLEAVSEVKNGQQLSKIITNQGALWPDMVSQMLAVGEETGSTETILVKVADFYEEEVDLALDQIGSIIEPVMIVIMGGMVGLIAASVMSPIANLSNAVG
ncbi:MAG: type II secretion system F family protein [Candidatus Saccharibacteria bacterium]|nr:type II secretion system F family protein [Candidatus Saccharibacteria bacterium]